MLPKPNRLKVKGEFKRTLSGRRLCGNEFFVLYGLAAHSAAGPSVVSAVSPAPMPVVRSARPTRFGFIVSKKIHKRATQRNRIRRRLREILRRHLQDTQADGFTGYRSMVFIARPESWGASYQQLKQKMERCLQGLRPQGQAHMNQAPS